MKHKIWRRLFVNITMVFMLFTAVVCVANSTLFVQYFTWYQKNQLRACAKEIYSIDITDHETAQAQLSAIESDYNVYITMYYDTTPVYSTVRRPGEKHLINISGFDMLVDKSSTGVILESQADKRSNGNFNVVKTSRGTVYIVYNYYGNETGGLNVSVMLERSLIENSAAAASRFVIMITSACLVAVLVWSVVFSRRFTRPIEKMNTIAENMSKLDFSQKIEVENDDEIGRLAGSLNQLSESLDLALKELNERNRKLEDEIESERRLDRMRKEFVAGVSHELKTPIAIVQGYAEGLSGDMAEDDTQRKKYSEVIIDESKRMNRLVLDLLELSRYESGVDRNETEFDLAASLINIIDKNSVLLDKKHIKLQMDFGECQSVLGDRLMFEQVVQNYLSNAISHTPDGGTVRIYTEPYKEKLRVCVFNSGSHVPHDEMENIWQSFYRTDKSHNRAQGRFGLGLSIVKAIMLCSGNEFGVFNTDDGVTFWAQTDIAD